MSTINEKSSVLSAKFKSGPLGLGDPDDLSLRKVETEVMIPKKMRDIARKEKCLKEVAAFSECCKNSSIFMVVSCRNENSALKECLTRWYENDEFKTRCKNEYLKERSEYRRTGINKQKSERIANLL